MEILDTDDGEKTLVFAIAVAMLVGEVIAGTPDRFPTVESAFDYAGQIVDIAKKRFPSTAKKPKR